MHIIPSCGILYCVLKYNSILFSIIRIKIEIRGKKMFEDPKGPIEYFSWGKYIINGEEHSKTDDIKIGKGKDIRLIGDKVTKWKERKGHILDKSMISGIFENKIEILIIGIGEEGMLDCPEDVKKYIYSNGIKELILEKTSEACGTYNKLHHKNKKVALLAHGTC